MMCTVQMLRHDAYNCPIAGAWRMHLHTRLKSGLLMTNQIREFDIVMIINEIVFRFEKEYAA